MDQDQKSQWLGHPDFIQPKVYTREQIKMCPKIKQMWLEDIAYVVVHVYEVRSITTIYT